MVQFYEQMLLFSMEKGKNCTLYFVEFETLTLDLPEIRRFTVKRGWFNSFMPGTLYKLEIRGERLVRYRKQKEFLITDPYYLMLMELRGLRFGKTKDEKRVLPSYLYSFEELRQLIAYKEPPLWRWLLSAARGGAFCAALALPCLVYVALMYLVMSGGSVIGVPAVALCGLPAMTTAMAWAYFWCEGALLRGRATRYGLLRAYALKTGGYRRPLGMSERLKAQLLKLTLITGGILGASLITLLF